MSSKLKILHSKITSDKGKELLILHGFLGMGDNWKTYANVLTKIGYRVHLIDQRNHGKSFWSEEFSYSVMAEDILNYCKFHKPWTNFYTWSFYGWQGCYGACI